MISYCIITMNRRDDLLDCLNDIAAQNTTEASELILILQRYTSSDENEIESIGKRLFPRCIVDKNPQGLGVFGARNRALELASGEFLAFLDDDCRVPPTWAERLLAGFTSSSIGGVGGFVNHPQRKYSTLKRTLYSMFGGNPSRYLIDWGGFHAAPVTNFPKKTMSADWMSGGNMMIRHESAREAGTFSAMYGNYGFDDCDYSIRIRKRGFSLVTVPDATADHFPSTVDRPDPRSHLAAEEERRVLFARQAIGDRAMWHVRYLARFCIHLTLLCIISTLRFRPLMPLAAVQGMLRGLARTRARHP